MATSIENLRGAIANVRTDAATSSSAGGMKRIADEYLDDLLYELDQIETNGPDNGIDQDDPKGKEKRLQEIQREIALVKQMMTGEKAPQQWEGWWQATKNISTYALRQHVVPFIGCAVASAGMNIALVILLGSNPLGAGLMGIMIGAAVLYGAYKLGQGLYNWLCGKDSKQELKKSAERELGLEGKSVGMSAMSSTRTPPTAHAAAPTGKGRDNQEDVVNSARTRRQNGMR